MDQFSVGGTRNQERETTNTMKWTKSRKSHSVWFLLLLMLLFRCRASCRGLSVGVHAIPSSNRFFFLFIFDDTIVHPIEREEKRSPNSREKKNSPKSSEESRGNFSIYIRLWAYDIWDIICVSVAAVSCAPACIPRNVIIDRICAEDCTIKSMAHFKASYILQWTNRSLFVSTMETNSDGVLSLTSYSNE